MFTETVEPIIHNGKKVGSIRSIWGSGYLMTIGADTLFSRHILPTLDLARDYAAAVLREHPEIAPPAHPAHCHCPECDPDNYRASAADEI